MISLDVVGLTREFPYPEKLAEDREADRKGVEALLQILLEDYGCVSAIDPLGGVPPALFSTVASGVVKFFNSRQFFVRYPYRVQCAKRSDGYLFIDVMRFDGRWVLRSISFALPAERPDSAEMVANTLKRMTASVRSSPTQ